jgi:agmatine/peptidylarginine deiminase
VAARLRADLRLWRRWPAAGGSLRLQRLGEKFPPWEKDAAVGGLIAARVGDAVDEATLILEGGSILSDGAGRCSPPKSVLSTPTAIRI